MQGLLCGGFTTFATFTVFTARLWCGEGMICMKRGAGAVKTVVRPWVMPWDAHPTAADWPKLR